jgi:ribonuclease HI
VSVRIYTDGSHVNGNGGWAALMFVDGVLTDGTYGGKRETTNNQMELQGVIEGMLLLPTVWQRRCSNCGVVSEAHFKEPKYIDFECVDKGSIQRGLYVDPVIVTDSQYCVNGATQWVHGWKANGWKTAQKQPVKNKPLWERVDKLARLTGATFEWVKGHNGDFGNNLADLWATDGRTRVVGEVLSDAKWQIPSIPT